MENIYNRLSDAYQLNWPIKNKHAPVNQHTCALKSQFFSYHERELSLGQATHSQMSNFSSMGQSLSHKFDLISMQNQPAVSRPSRTNLVQFEILTMLINKILIRVSSYTFDFLYTQNKATSVVFATSYIVN